MLVVSIVALELRRRSLDTLHDNSVQQRLRLAEREKQRKMADFQCKAEEQLKWKVQQAEAHKQHKSLRDIGRSMSTGSGHCLSHWRFI